MVTIYREFSVLGTNVLDTEMKINRAKVFNNLYKFATEFLACSSETLKWQ